MGPGMSRLSLVERGLRLSEQTWNPHVLWIQSFSGASAKNSSGGLMVFSSDNCCVMWREHHEMIGVTSQWGYLCGVS